MSQRVNYLLGFGERLAEPVELKGGGGPKQLPYDFEESRERLGAMFEGVVEKLWKLPDNACPEGEAVASVTLHPEFFAKSYYPSSVIEKAGLRTVGSRSRTVVPEKCSRDRSPEKMVTTELFVAGPRSRFDEFAESLPGLAWEKTFARHLAAVEELRIPDPHEKVRLPDPVKDLVPLEVVLHASETPKDRFILKGFQSYAKEFGRDPDLERTFFAGGLCFLRMYARPEETKELAKYSFLRVVREMPRLRTTAPVLRGWKRPPKPAELPDDKVVDGNLRVAVFDGGLAENSELLRWTEVHDVAGVGEATEELLWHGETVTSALLFGSVDPGATAEQPVCRVDHFRVLDSESEKDPFELYDVLDRIETVLNTRPYEFVSLSTGPCLPVDDDDVHSWTAVLDAKLSNGQCLATIAAGNTGQEPEDPVLQLRRVQVPSDCVNGLTVGAADRKEERWRRAIYSSVGPGRSPGIVKPDLVAFGGETEEPFWVFDPVNPRQLVATAGTSYAAPAALRAGAGIRAHFGQVLSPLAIKALLVHCTEDNGTPREDVGWGRLPSALEDFTVCGEGLVRIVYQDEITASKYRRIRIPLPRGGLKGDVHIAATFCFTTDVDPEHPGNYTRSGLQVFFRPHKGKFAKADATQPKTAAFFQPAQLYPVEQELRSDAHKWETCLNMRRRKRSSSLDDPVFDIHYNARMGGQNDPRFDRIRYALVISVEAPKVKDLYDQVVRAYQNILQPLNPVIAVPVRI